MDWYTDVKAYLMICVNGLPEADRPASCGFCSSKRTPHRHGKFMRWLFTIDDAFHIPLFRFLCPDCRQTFCIVPDFVETHHQSAIDVKEEVVLAAAAEGRSLAEIAEQSSVYAGGSYSEMSLWRWLKRWSKRKNSHEQQLWSTILHRGLHTPLPRERVSGWRALFVAWSSLKQPDRLFHLLLRLDRSFTMTDA